jgi:hypothetical protein
MNILEDELISTMKLEAVGFSETMISVALHRFQNDSNHHYEKIIQKVAGFSGSSQ